MLDEAIADGRALAAVRERTVLCEEWKHWHETNYRMLRERWGLSEAQAFANAGGEAQAPEFHALAAAQVRYLESLRATEEKDGVKTPPKWVATDDRPKNHKHGRGYEFRQTLLD